MRVSTFSCASTGQKSPFPLGTWPTETYIARTKSMYLNDDGIQVMRQPAAHSDGDSIVFFRRADVIVTGDILDLRQFPVIDAARGGGLQGEIDALNRLLDLAVPAMPLIYKEGRTYLVPGHGRIADHAEVVEYRDMVTVIRDVVQSMVAKGMTLQQVKAANPTEGYRRRYGADSGAWTTDLFVEAVYKNLATPPRTN
jgi:cyclase